MKKYKTEIFKEYRGFIVLYYSNKGQVLRLTTNIKVGEEKEPENKLYLDALEISFKKLVLDYKTKYNQNPDTEFIKNKLKGFKVYKTFFEIYDDYIEYRFKDKSKGTQRNLNSLKQNLIEFNKVKEIKLNNINTEFINDFLNFLYKKNQSNNTTRKKLIYLKSFIKYLADKELIKDVNISYQKIVKPRDGFEYFPENETLTKDELKYIISRRDNIDKKYKKTLDMFIFQCLTSLRYSDLINIRENDINRNRLTYSQVKTGKPIEINLTNILLTIFKENNFDFNHLNNAKYNRVLKLMFKDFSEDIPEFKKKIKYTKNVYNSQLSKNEELMEYRYNLISSHTGRRTFINICLELNIPINDIMKYTGHNRMEIINHYINRGHNRNINLSDNIEKGLI